LTQTSQLDAIAPRTFEASQKKNGAQVMTTDAEEHHHAKPPAEAAADSHDRKVRVLVADILQGGREAILEHDGMDYRLRITANGKLILTK
jgi:hemin uptake protein HemP